MTTRGYLLNAHNRELDLPEATLLQGRPLTFQLVGLGFAAFPSAKATQNIEHILNLVGRHSLIPDKLV